MSALVFSAIWLTLISVALYLISLRDDRLEIFGDLQRFLSNIKTGWWLFVLILIILILPLSIPYSASHIEKRNNSNE
jgi:hypothetical protein